MTNNGSIQEIDEEESEVENTDLQWFKKNINAQALPNGYCRLPVIAGPCPPCSEAVKWVVLEESIEMSKEQIDKFCKISPDNHRPVQSLNEREVKEND
ncbi:carbonic anhydrase family protein [Sporosarcina sp. P13]|uniref:carbonic anhydrase family protein n=1 Tax=Sporosarcina sp. P13 TaxID=2048263 RepID=UPI0018ECF313